MQIKNLFGSLKHKPYIWFEIKLHYGEKSKNSATKRGGYQS